MTAAGWLVALLAAGGMAAQEPRRDVVVVTGTYEPAPLEETDRSIDVLEVSRNALLAGSVIDFLKLDPALDLRQRAPGGVQADLSIRGGSFGQTLVLLDGMRLNDAQSGHHNMDIPLPLEAVDRIEILRGSSSTLYGSEAVGGVVDVITRSPEISELRLRTAVGNYGVNQQSGALTGVAGGLSERLDFSRDSSSGFAPDRDSRSAALSSITAYRGSRIVLAASDKPFGAAGFYGDFNSWERTRTWFAAASQKIGEGAEAQFSFRRHTDLFVLYRDRPEVYTNRHAVESWTGALRRREELGANVRLYYGGEFLADSIASSNLGRHARNREAVYAALDARAVHRFSFNAGLRDEMRGLRHELSPTLAGGVWLSPRWKLRASAARAFRLPSYTDLYYHDPANLGSPSLRPETAWSYEAGLDWNTGARLSGGLAVFERRESNGIDYVRYNRSDLWRAANFARLRFSGVEAAARVRIAPDQRLELRYSGLHGASQIPAGLETKYVFNYPVHSAVLSWEALAHGLMARTRVGALVRLGRDPYALWDAYVARAGGRLRPFVHLANITGTRYEEIPGVAMPGRSIAAGFEYALRLR